MSDIAALLQAQGFFAGLAEAPLAQLATLAAEQEVAAGTLLFRQGEAANRFFLIRQGLVSVEIYAAGRDPVVVESLHDGDVVGWSWLIPPYRWSFDARVVEPSSLIGFDAPALRERAEADPVLGYQVLRRFVPVMAHRLASARERLVECLAEPR